MTHQHGEATIALAIGGALVTAGPVVVAAGFHTLDDANAVAIFVASVLASATAIGAGVGKLWRRGRANDVRNERFERALFGDPNDPDDHGAIGAIKRIDARGASSEQMLREHLRTHGDLP